MSNIIKRHIVIASHSTLAEGMANALKFFEGDSLKLTVLSACMLIPSQLKDRLKKYLINLIKMMKLLF